MPNVRQFLHHLIDADSSSPRSLRLTAYAIALGATAAALALRWVLDPLLYDNLTLVTIYVAVVISVWLGGLGPAVLSIVLGYVGSNVLFMEPRGTLSLFDSTSAVRALGFLVSAGAVVALGVGLRRARQRVLIEQRKLAGVLGTIDDQFVMLDRQWRYTYANDRAIEATGRRPDELLGNVIWDLYPGLLGTAFERTARRALAAQRPARVEFYYAPRTNWLESRFYPSRDGIALLVNDVTGQRRTANDLAKRVAEQSALFEFTDQLQHARSLDEVVEAALDAMSEALGCSRASILLFDQDGVMRFTAWRGLSEAYRHAVEGHSPWKPDEQNIAPIWIPSVDTADLPDSLRAAIQLEGIRALGFIPLIAGGALIGKFMLYYDAPHPHLQEEENLALTIARQLALAIERQRTEQARQRSAADLLEANRRKDEFLAILAHELRNPLAPLVNMLHLLRHSSGNAELEAQSHATMDRQLKHLVRLVDDLLDVGRITRNRLELRRERVELTAVIRQTVDACRPMMERLTQQVMVAQPEEPIYLDADPVRLAQVFGNLLSNASKFTPRHGEIALNVQRDAGDAVVSISDTGVGIEAEALPRVFDLFSHVDGALEHSRGGLGIGLTLVKQLVEMHGGSVAAVSAGIGAGSTFTVRLPVVAGEPVVPASVAESAPARSEPRRILVVDDNHDAAESLANILRMAGHQAVVAHDGLQAVAAAARHRPDIVLLDLGLPNLDGFEACRRIRQEPWSAGMVLIAITGWGQDDYRRRSEEAGFDDHLVKPVSPSLLLDMVATTARASARADR